MKKSKFVPLLFVGAILLPGCGGPAPRNTTGMNPPAMPSTPNAPVPYFVTCKNCKTINEVAEGGSVCRQCGKPLETPAAPVASTPQNRTGASTSPRTHASSGPIFVPSLPSSGSRSGSSSSGTRTYSGSSTRTPVAPSHSSGGSSYSSSKPSSSSSSSTSRGGFGTSSRSSVS